jgi:hypothetical protein
MIRTIITIELTDGENLQNAIKALTFGWPNFQVLPDPPPAPQTSPVPYAEQNTHDTTNGFSDGTSDVNDALQHVGDQIAAGTLHHVAPPSDKTVVVTRETKLTAMDGDRERGKAGPGHRRRTNEQIKADDEYFASLPKDAPLAPGSEQPMISTGEERINPEDAAQDAADEAAETEARKAERGGKLTTEDLRAAVGRYIDKFGVKASIEAIRTVIGKPIIEVKEDELAAAIERVEAAITGATVEPPKPAETESVFGDAVADKPTEPVHATKTDVVEAFTAYGKKYDGTTDPAKMEITRQDLPKVLEKMFGAGATTIGKIPQTPEGFGRAMTAVYEAVRNNPFKREARA